MVKLQIILGSTRPGRVGESVAKWAQQTLAKRDDVEVELVDVADYNLPLLDEPVPPMMNQYTKELKMGDLQSVTFTVDQGALQIFAAGIIYFATLSKPEQALPIYELSLIARELSRHTK